MRERDSMAAQLQANEEEHLLVSKRLVDAQIEVIRAQEEADKKSFEQTTKILTLESELQQRTAQVAELTLQVDDLKVRVFFSPLALIPYLCLTCCGLTFFLHFKLCCTTVRQAWPLPRKGCNER